MTDQMRNSAQSDTVLQLTARVRELEAALRAAETKDDKTSSAASETEAPPSAPESSVKMEAPLLDAPEQPKPSTVPNGNSIPTPSVSLLYAQSQAAHTIPTPSVSVPLRKNVTLPNNNHLTSIAPANTTTSISLINREQNNIELPPNQALLGRAVPAPIQQVSRTAAASQDAPAPNYQELMYPTGASKQCSCKKSRCLKLYCECFAANVFCKDCKCNDCHNVPEHAEIRMRAIQYKLQRRPGAFKPKFTPKVGEKKQAEGMRHSRGCNCKKSGCNKRYCECYQNGVACSAACKCTQCKNSAVAPLPSTIPRRAPDSVKKGFLSWRIPLSADVVNAMGTKSKRNRKVFPADFVPGQEPSFTFTPFGGTAPSLHPAPSSTSSDGESSRKRRREAVRDPVEQSSVKRRSTRVKRSTRHRAGSQESMASAMYTDGSDSFYSCSNSEDAESELEIEFMDTDPELAAALFDAVDAGQMKSTPGDQLGDSGLWLTEDFNAAPNISFQSLSDSVPDLNRALQDARKEMQSTENTVGAAKPVIDDFCMDDIQLAKPDIQLATEPSTDTLANSSSTLCGSIVNEDWIVSDSMLDDVACPGFTGQRATSKLDDSCADSFLRHDSTDSFFSGLAA